MNLMTAHILRGLQLLFAIIVLGCTAAVLDATSGVGSTFAFMLFNSLWTILVVAYFMLTPRFFEPAANKYAFFGVDLLTMIFWFAGFIAMSVDISRLNYFYEGTRWWQSGAAGCAFGAFEWVLFTVATVLNALAAFKGGSSGKTEATNPNPEFGV